MPTAVIAEDEPLLLDELRDMLRELWPELIIVAESSDGISALHAIESHKPDVAFLDIRMPKMSGIEVAEQMQGLTQIVFVTAYDEHAIVAFEKGAVDYILKPIKLTRLAATIKRVKAHSESSKNNGIVKALNWIQATVGHQLRFIAISEVLFFQSDSKYTRVVTAEHHALIRKSLGTLMGSLDGELFRQINRGMVVNVRHIDRVERSSVGEMFVRVRNVEDALPVTKSFQAQFRGM